MPWLLETCLEDGVDPDSVIAPQAQDFLVERLSAPVQFAEHLNRAFTDAFHLGAETVTRELVENTLSVGFDSLDAKLARIGYTPKALAERFDAHPAEIWRFLNGRLPRSEPHSSARPCATPAFRTERAYSQLMWVRADDCKSVADIVSTFARSVSIPGPSFANNPSRNRGCLRAGRLMIASSYR